MTSTNPASDRLIERLIERLPRRQRIRAGVVVPSITYADDRFGIAPAPYGWLNYFSDVGRRPVTKEEHEAWFEEIPANFVELKLPKDKAEMWQLWRDDATFHAVGMMFREFFREGGI